MKDSLYIVIVGCGRLGSYLANQLSLAGHSVVVIDSNEANFSSLSSDFSGFRLVGDATELAVLREAKLDKADVLLATAREDNVNLMVAQIAGRLFHVGKVLARVFDPEREQVYKQHGIETVCPTSLVATSLMTALSAGGDTDEKVTP